MAKKLVKSILFLLLAIVVALGATFAYAQTRMAKDQIGGFIEEQLENEHQSAEIENIDGVLPFDIRLGRFRLSDDAGVWLEVDDARVEMSPTRLLKGELFVEQLGAARVAVHRQPNLPPAPEPPPSDEPFACRLLPSFPTPCRSSRRSASSSTGSSSVSPCSVRPPF